MKQTIAVHTDLSWFSRRATKGRYTSAKEALAAHISYVLRKEECVFSYNLDKKQWLQKADEYIQKRVDSKIAGKKMFALPRGLSTKEQAQLVKEFLTQNELFSVRVNGKRIRVKLASNDFGFAIHRGRNSVSGKENPHVHIVFRPKVLFQGKEYSLHINKRELRELHQKWENFLKAKGFEIRKNPEMGEPHFGPQKLRRESNVFSPRLYEAYRKFRLARQHQERLQSLRQRARIKFPREEAELLFWDEIQAEEETPTRGERVFQERVSVQKSTPKPRPSPKSVRKLKPRPKVVRYSYSGLQQQQSVQQQPTKPGNEAEREFLKFSQKLEDEIERKRQEEELRQQREAEMLQQFEEDDFDFYPEL